MIGSAVQYSATLGAGVGGAAVGGVIVWQVWRYILSYFGGEPAVSYTGNGLGRLREAVATDNEAQLAMLEGRLLKRLEEVRTELRQNWQEVRQDMRDHKKESDGRFAELERRGRR